MEYKLKLQQLVSYSRCRIYRKFIRSLTADPNIRLNGNSYLYYYMVLFSYANFRTSLKNIEGVFYTIGPGEWLMPIKDLAKIYRKKTIKSTLEILDYLASEKWIDYKLECRGHYIRFSIINWSKFNTIVEDKAPCNKDEGFFFFPHSLISNFIGKGKCSEMDIILDLWMNTIYNDFCISGSDVAPVVYFRNGTQTPLIGYDELGKRWGVSKSTAGRIMRKLEDNGYIEMVAFQGRYGSVIYLCNYLSTMFEVPEKKIEREDVAMALNIKIDTSKEGKIDEQIIGPDMEDCDSNACQIDENEMSEPQICVAKNIISVPKAYVEKLIKNVAERLCLQGFSCASCTRARYLLSRLSKDCKSNINNAELLILCAESNVVHRLRLLAENVHDCVEREVR